MPRKVIARAPEARCYKCGSTVIHSVCHHCARAMCAAHSRGGARERALSWSPTTGAAGRPGQPGAPATPAPGVPGADTRPPGREFGGLKLPPALATVHHCEEHDHNVGPLHRWQQPAAEPTPLPVFPNVNNASVVERLTGEVQLTEAGYRSTARPVEGTIDIDMSHDRWHDTMARYRKRHQAPEGHPVRFAAGFALLRGKAGLAFDPGQEAVLRDGLGLEFRGLVAGHDLFDAKPGCPEGEWRLSARYSLQPDRAPQDIPLWIVPSLGATSGKQVLMIDLHWNMPEVDGNRPELTQFELIEFQVPHQWGNLQKSSPPGAASPAPLAGQPRIVRWRQHRPAADERQRRSGPGTAPRSMTLEMRFEKPILDHPWLSGSLRASFNRTLSGVTGLNFYLPGGGPVQHLDVKPRTEVSVRFQVSLGNLRYQERRTVPDESDTAGGRSFRPKSDKFDGVRPDHRTVIELTNAISADGYYVKTVVEDSPHRDSRARVLNRGWDITGRWYEGVFPIDFTIRLHGTEPADRAARPEPAWTIVQVTVDGMFPNAEMKKRIEDKWDGLHERVTGLLRSLALHSGDSGVDVIHGVPNPREIASSAAPVPAVPPSVTVTFPYPAPSQPSEPPEWPSTPAPGESYRGNVVPGQVINDSPSLVPVDQGGWKEQLQGQLRELRRLFGEQGLIGERTCREAIADVRAELRYLQEPDALLTGPGDPARVEEVADLLRQRTALRGRLIARQLSEDFHRDLVADINTELTDLGWLQ